MDQVTEPVRKSFQPILLILCKFCHTYADMSDRYLHKKWSRDVRNRDVRVPTRSAHAQRRDDSVVCV